MSNIDFINICNTYNYGNNLHKNNNKKISQFEIDILLNELRVYNVYLHNSDIIKVVARSGNEALNICIKKYNYIYDDFLKIEMIEN